MAIDLDDEILQDFLVEAGEILELLSEQLVELEESPEDADLLNAVFRGFHTVKGGAGFLALDPMVDCCHVCEDVFNVLRNDERKVSPGLMDCVLQALDAVQIMFAEIQEGDDPTAATEQLLADLKVYAVPGDSEPGGAVSEPSAPAPVEEAAPAQDEADQDITDDEFDALLDAMDEKDKTEEVADAGSDSSDITDDEFESLLDDLHGKGKHGGGKPIEDEKPAEAPKSDAGETADDLMTDDEFDSILDQMHGKGKGPTAADTPAAENKDEPAKESAGDELITDDEFDAILDQMHGKGKGPTADNPAEKAATPEVAAEKPKPAAPAPKKEPAKAKAPAKPAAEASVRVDTERLDEMMNLVGELVLVRNRLQTLRSTMQEGKLTHAITNLDMVTADLQTSVMKTRMQPIKKVFGRFPRVVRDLSRSINKEIKLEMMGEDTDLDKNLVEALADPLVHLVRNAVDHGIELPGDREKKGKPRVGTVILSATQEGDHILLAIEDDGAGMDPEILRTKVVEKGLMDEEAAARMDDKECFNLIFMAGFSTKEEISDISGRGVGMDVVKTRITQLNGTLDIDSVLGKGTTLSIKVPLTLAILPTLMIAMGEHTFALSLANVNEIFELETRKTNVVDGQLMVMVREKAVPLFYLSNWLLKPGEECTSGDGVGQVIIVSVGNRLVGLVTDSVIGQEEVVIKPLGKMLQNLAEFAGSTITGDGGIALIIDVPSLLKARANY
ncbi:MAG: chemotaxis protein CheA [endosymbiont of Galathealinum brachiosum]|uniref:Chemotaxis protein CheA n=1 Tax=endosymbiont of Galathealinum brachiosum TaxID=2200906 RepID=A0A370D9A7_9GAMM|nr:MAG: chemotaxis protein CheA [endosymbiont of Galathealinum brachiosum]